MARIPPWQSLLGDTSSGEAGRESIWSVRRGAIQFYYVLFGALFLTGTGLLYATSLSKAATWPDGLILSLPYLSALGISSAVVALVVLELAWLIVVLIVLMILAGRRTVMVLGDFLLEKMVKMSEKRRNTPREEPEGLWYSQPPKVLSESPPKPASETRDAPYQPTDHQREREE